MEVLKKGSEKSKQAALCLGVQTHVQLVSGKKKEVYVYNYITVVLHHNVRNCSSLMFFEVL